MKRQNGRLSVALSFLAALMLGGCETKSTDELEVLISPSRATIRQGETIELKASGWGSYRWSIASPSLGSLTPATGETVYYFATAATNAVQVVTVVGTGTSSGTSSVTNATAGVIDLTGEAYITHVAPEPEEEEEEEEENGNGTTTNTTTTTTTSTTA
jgi:hypothetical protein